MSDFDFPTSELVEALDKEIAFLERGKPAGDSFAERRHIERLRAARRVIDDEDGIRICPQCCAEWDGGIPDPPDAPDVEAGPDCVAVV